MAVISWDLSHLTEGTIVVSAASDLYPLYHITCSTKLLTDNHVDLDRSCNNSVNDTFPNQVSEPTEHGAPILG